MAILNLLHSEVEITWIRKHANAMWKTFSLQSGAFRSGNAVKSKKA